MIDFVILLTFCDVSFAIGILILRAVPATTGS
jgi:hypothetical protein